jgi:hypothetical protein
MSKIYIVGSLRAGHVRQVAQALRAEGHEVFDDWHACHPDADETWREYEQARGRDFVDALYDGHFVANCFEFDRKHMMQAEIIVLVLPAGKSGHLELGWALGQGKRGYILLEEEQPQRWDMMYLFANKVCRNLEELIERVR